ncbi:MAG: hypothetical protein HKN13_10395, partial [Rhodothermales bacterium]|nr:hypothetical protein [Rhodothermales bacterium]
MPDSPSSGIRLFLPALATLLLVSLIWTPGCDSGDPGDTLGLITRIQLSLGSAEPPLSATASVRGVDGLGTGATIVTDTLLLQLGVTYEGTIRLFGAGDRDVTSTVENEAENYQIFYTIEGATGVAVTVTDVESDYGPNTFGEDLRVGLAFRVIVSENAPAEGRISVRAGEFAQGRKNGLTLTVEPVVDVVVPFRVGSGAPITGPGSTETITRAELSLARIDGTHTWTINAESSGGLNLGPNEVPGSLTIESCETDNGAVTCTDRDTLVLRPGIYQGSWDLHDSDVVLNDEISEEGVWHRFFHAVNFGDAFSDYDLDGSGLPLGLRFRMDAPEGVIIGSGSFGVRLGHFNPDAGEVKGEENEPAAFDMQYRIPMQLHQNGPPELITRAVLALRRADGMETVTVTAAADNLQLRGAEP